VKQIVLHNKLDWQIIQNLIQIKIKKIPNFATIGMKKLKKIKISTFFSVFQKEIEKKLKLFFRLT